ncbi:MAG: BamA/TamA family outer membrane protein [Elusimicrobia bacterium]|nr:BamA/TamA family outer membrane protein [Elusimicrobiota bacterium]
MKLSRILPPCAATLLFCCSCALAVTPSSGKKDKKDLIDKKLPPQSSASQIKNPEDDLFNSREEILGPIQQASTATAAGSDWAEKIMSRVVINLPQGPLLLLPVVDSSRDTGPNYGIMPIWALRDEKRQAISSVIVPSVNYNQYFHTTYTYRHYFFPDDKQLWFARGSYSTVMQRELFLKYFNPEVAGTRYRVNAEARHWINGKASYYGMGPDSTEAEKATYALDLTGEEFTVGFPLPKNCFFEFTHSFYSYKVMNGPINNIPSLEQNFPTVYNSAINRKSFLNTKLALQYDGTDHPVIPKIGTFASAAATFSKRGVGSDYSYTAYTLETKEYYNYKEEGKAVTALHAVYQYQHGDAVPFYALPVLGESTGLRAVGDGRYVDNGKLALSIEERFTITRLPVLKFFTELEVAPFIDAGTVFSDNDDIRMKEMKIAYGAAFRIVIRPQVVAAADFAYGKEGSNIIIHVGYPF